MIKKYANVLYNQKINNYVIPYLAQTVDFKLLEKKCKEYTKLNNKISKIEDKK
ncbi:MAG: type III toxin-antitoxin system ToxN/AbiQ family toxin [Bacilli bacterium]|nr:type III toxin-antitoxin system ToxN/AbiQ family toxin [Bacilli bacterium]